ncbi:hypothetical protein CDD83_4761 [Cordyceps sp. RAO-2017]|nr:hypothetical protein CDD83_4761 [Cordyceps sp. RAO-2017]
MADRRRIYGPGGQCLAPFYTDEDTDFTPLDLGSLTNVTRAIFLKTGVTPSASGSAYLEMESGNGNARGGMRLSCSVHGPRSLPRAAPFSPHMVLSTYVKYAPFATQQKKAFMRDASERDLSLHLETALRGAVIADRWPKSGVDIIVTVLESEVAPYCATNPDAEACDIMGVLSSCITVAAAAIADAGIDCVDTITSGVATLLEDGSRRSPGVVLPDLPASSSSSIMAACCVAFLPTRNEITAIWLRGRMPTEDTSIYQKLAVSAVHASQQAKQAIQSCYKDTILIKG